MVSEAVEKGMAENSYGNETKFAKWLENVVEFSNTFIFWLFRFPLHWTEMRFLNFYTILFFNINVCNWKEEVRCAYTKIHFYRQFYRQNHNSWWTQKHNNFMVPGAIHIGATHRQNHNEKEIHKHTKRTKHVNMYE